MSKHTNEFWLRKVKLYCTLHGINFMGVDCKTICPHWLYEKDFGHRCDLPWPDKLCANEDLTKAGKEPYNCTTFNHCIEWIKHV